MRRFLSSNCTGTPEADLTLDMYWILDYAHNPTTGDYYFQVVLCRLVWDPTYNVCGFWSGYIEIPPNCPSQARGNNSLCTGTIQWGCGGVATVDIP